MRAGPGRPLGGRNAETRMRAEAATEFSKKIVDDPEYQQTLIARAKSGSLHPHIEALILHYRFGKPVDNVYVEVNDERPDLSRLSEADLARRAEAIAAAIRAGRDEDKRQVAQVEPLQAPGVH